MRSNSTVSLPASCCGFRALARRVHRVRSLDVNVHLLSHVKRSDLILNPVNDLENARIHTLGAITGERQLRNHIGLEADELQCNSYRTVSTRRRRRLFFFAMPPPPISTLFPYTTLVPSTNQF